MNQPVVRKRAVQAHMGRITPPISDYVTDTKSALDNSLRVLQAMTDAAADAGYLGTALAAMALVQSLMQVRPDSDMPSTPSLKAKKGMKSHVSAPIRLRADRTSYTHSLSTLVPVCEHLRGLSGVS